MQIKSEIGGAVWKIEVAVGQQVQTDEVLLILESMKMEVPVVAPAAGRVRQVAVAEGANVEEDDLLVVLDPS